MKLSIITINLNNREGLKKTFESVSVQTFKDFEYIVIDGGSTDGSRELIEKNADRFAYWVSEPDSGVYNAMNKGIQKAKGDYVLFLNSGDFLIEKEVLGKVFASELTADIVNARCNVSDHGKLVWTSPYLPKVTLKTLYSVGLPHQSTFIKRAMFDRFGLYRDDFKYNSDIAFWYKAILFGDAITHGLDMVTTDYDQNGMSGTQSDSETYKNEMREILSEGILPRVLPDYEEWAKEKTILQKYEWIESHPLLQRFLTIYYKVCKHI